MSWEDFGPRAELSTAQGQILPGKILTPSRVSIGMLALVRAYDQVKFFLERKSQRVDAL